MANNLTNAIETRLIDWMNGVGSPVRPTPPLKVALFTTLPNQETGLDGVEVNGFGYARATLTFSSASDGAASNTGDITFPAASGGSWGTIVGIGVYDSAITPLLMWVAPLSSNKVIDDGDIFRLSAGAITESLN